METQDFLEIVNALGPAIGVLAVVMGTVIAGWFQASVARRQTAETHKSQLNLLEQTHRQNMEILTLQQRREEDLRRRQFEESDHADRLVVIEYVDLLLPRLIEVASIHYISSDNNDTEELARFSRFQREMLDGEIDAVHPERSRGLRMAFLLFQLVASMRIALNARWVRPLTAEHASFLSHWESHIEPMVCSGRYPGKELLYREQLEIIGSEMLVAPAATGVVRPIHWKEFCEKVKVDSALLDLADVVAGKLRYIFDESGALPARKAMQCRLAIMALYLIQLSNEAGNDSWARRGDALWRIVVDWYKWERSKGQEPKWFVFAFGDVAQRAWHNESPSERR